MELSFACSWQPLRMGHHKEVENDIPDPRSNQKAAKKKAAPKKKAAKKKATRKKKK